MQIILRKIISNYNIQMFLFCNVILVILSGYAVGSLVGGILYKEVGGAITLRIFSMLAAVSALMYLILHTLYLKYNTPGEKSSNFNRQRTTERVWPILVPIFLQFGVNVGLNEH